jgi:RNA polymerase sigma-70 factor, ECF subfamily
LKGRLASTILGSATATVPPGTRRPGGHMPVEADSRDFGEYLLPHLNAAYNLARWLTGNRQDAEDLAQDAYLRALRFFPGFRGGDARAWLLRIVRNTCYTWLQDNRVQALATAFDEERHSDEGEISDPATLLLQKSDRQLIQQALGELPPKFREMLVLRELEGLSYKEIADVAGVPMGTVMSGLARARVRLRRSVTDLLNARTPRRGRGKTGWRAPQAAALEEAGPRPVAASAAGSTSRVGRALSPLGPTALPGSATSTCPGRATRNLHFEVLGAGQAQRRG